MNYYSDHIKDSSDFPCFLPNPQSSDEISFISPFLTTNTQLVSSSSLSSTPFIFPSNLSLSASKSTLNTFPLPTSTTSLEDLIESDAFLSSPNASPSSTSSSSKHSSIRAPGSFHSSPTPPPIQWHPKINSYQPLYVVLPSSAPSSPASSPSTPPASLAFPLDLCQCDGTLRSPPLPWTPLAKFNASETSTTVSTSSSSSLLSASSLTSYLELMFGSHLGHAYASSLYQFAHLTQAKPHVQQTLLQCTCNMLDVVHEWLQQGEQESTRADPVIQDIVQQPIPFHTFLDAFTSDDEPSLPSRRAPAIQLPRHQSIVSYLLETNREYFKKWIHSNDAHAKAALRQSLLALVHRAPQEHVKYE
ncbi:hypothetical protein HMI54_001523 [Coelomomyces lativittatus]|nr:hypothetical protein HMI56_001690 [Coelomomyces lativittatus]KAJ1507047.1 hypothetical protein HMI55_000930 [Coelomomyces lativittatus]KAJ1510497.1 hypothetical protein HMI54_001523 [Coelomomyces lativittatus]